MSRVRQFLWMAVAAPLVAGCATGGARQAANRAETSGALSFSGGKRYKPVEPNYFRAAYSAKGKSSFRLDAPVAYDPAALRVYVSQGAWGDGEMQSRDWVRPLQSGPNQYLIAFGHDIKGEIDDNRIIKLEYIKPGTLDTSTYFFRYKKPVTFSGFSSPVLLRLSGQAAGFHLQNLAPSVATGVRWNNPFGLESVSYTDLNGLVTVAAVPPADNTQVAKSTTFALALGPEFDFAGVIQVGGTYQFKEQKWFLVVGLRPEILYRLTSGAFGND